MVAVFVQDLMAHGVKVTDLILRGGGSSLHLRIEKIIAASLACSVAMNDTRFMN